MKHHTKITTFAVLALAIVVGCKKEDAPEKKDKGEKEQASTQGSKGVRAACADSFQTLRAKAKDQDELTVTCPADCSASSVWGTGWYTTDSSVCSAAVQSGAIKKSKGGEVTLKLQKGLPAYSGTDDNGVTSADWGAFDNSFSVNDSKNANTQKKAGGKLTLKCTDSVKSLGDSAGAQFVGTCPKDCSGGSVWGSGKYTTDSTICIAAVHAGVIKPAEGGDVKIKVVDGEKSYKGSSKNGIKSSDWGPFEKSYTIE